MNFFGGENCSFQMFVLRARGTDGICVMLGDLYKAKQELGTTSLRAEGFNFLRRVNRNRKDIILVCT